MKETFELISSNQSKPAAVIASTIRGKGLPSIEQRADRWFCNFANDEVDMLINELHTRQKDDLTSETLVVR